MVHLETPILSQTYYLNFGILCWSRNQWDRKQKLNLRKSAAQGWSCPRFEPFGSASGPTWSGSKLIHAGSFGPPWPVVWPCKWMRYSEQSWESRNLSTNNFWASDQETLRTRVHLSWMNIRILPKLYLVGGLLRAHAWVQINSIVTLLCMRLGLCRLKYLQMD